MPNIESEPTASQPEAAQAKETVLSINHDRFSQKLEFDPTTGTYVLRVYSDLYSGGFDGGTENTVIKFSDSAAVAKALESLRAEGTAVIDCVAECSFDAEYWDHSYNVGGDDYDTHLLHTRKVHLELSANEHGYVINGWDKWFR